MSSLNPVYTVGWQLAEQIRAHTDVDAAGARERAVELLRSVGHPGAGAARRRLPAPVLGRDAPARDDRDGALLRPAGADRGRADDRARRDDPGADPRADRRRCASGRGSSVVLITHDMGVVAGIADRILVMYAGRVIEEGPTRAVFRDPQHPYTWSLLGSIPRLDRPRPRRLTAIPGAPPTASGPATGCAFAPRCPHRFERCDELPPLARASGRRTTSTPATCRSSPGRRSDRTRHERRPAARDRRAEALPRPRGRPAAARGRARAGGRRRRPRGAAQGETLGLVGESGCGKSTLARAPAPAHRPDGGHRRVRRARHLHARPRGAAADPRATSR